MVDGGVSTARAWLPILCAACLSTPPPRQDLADAALADAALADATPTPDARPRCELPGATVAFPPPGDLLVVPGAAVDLDCDGRDELILLVRADGIDQPRQGVYVIVTATGDAVFLATGADRPHAVLVEDLGGDAHLDLLVLAGRDTDGDPRVNELARLLAFEGQAGLGFTPIGAIDLPGNAPAPAGDFSTLWVTSLDLDGDAARDLMIALPRTLLVAELAAWGDAAILDGAPAQVGGLTWSGGQMVAFPSPGQPGFDDLVLNNRLEVHYFRNPGDGSRWTGSQDAQPIPFQGGFLDTRVFVHMDTDGIPEAVGASKFTQGAQGGMARITNTGKGLHLLADSLDDEVENVTDTLAAALDPGTPPDLAVLDKRAAEARLVVRPDLGRFGSDLTTGPARTYVFQGILPDTLIDGDFVPGGGREIVALSYAGARQCLVISATSITLCPP